MEIFHEKTSENKPAQVANNKKLIFFSNIKLNEP
jgi:hypothetical protein